MQKKVFYHNRIELLAPAGGMEQLTSAVENGADAVYLGGKSFNARAKAGNFDIEEIKTACRYCHIRGVKVYVTLNTLVGENEDMERIVSFAGELKNCNVDALIIQDIGLGAEIRKKYPDIELHLSTQGTVYNRSGVKAAGEMGYSRVILARECSLSQIRKITGEESLPEVEVFVHGALCFCYSGQCQLSRNIGGRSGNKGVCAQPCRLEYNLDGRRGFHLSPKDICTLDYLPEFVDAGVKSLKIEGRLKSAEYVGTVVGIYRKYLDLWYQLEKESNDNPEDISPKDLFEKRKKKYRVDSEDREKLMQAFNRGGFTEGYLISDPEEGLMTGDVSKNLGVKIGTVISCDRKQLVKTRLEKKYLDSSGVTDCGAYPFSMGDRIEIHSGNGELPGNIVTYLKNAGKNSVIAGDIKNIKNAIPAGAPVYRISSSKQISEIRKTYEEGGPYGTKHRAVVPVSFMFFGYKGSNPVLNVCLEESFAHEENMNSIEVTAEEDFVIPEAIKLPTDEAIIKKQLIKLGGTPFVCDEKNIEIRIDRDIMIPASVINSLRRNAIEKFADAIADQNANKSLNEKGLEKKCDNDRDEGVQNRTFNHVASGAIWFHTWKGFEDSKSKLKKFIVDDKNSGQSKILICVPVADWLKCCDSSDGQECHTYEGQQMPESRTEGLPEGLTEGLTIVPYLSAITMGAEDSFVEKNFDKIVKLSKEKSEGMLIVSNLGWMKEFIGAGLNVLAGHGLNVNNIYTAMQYLEMGVCDVFASLENSDYNCGMIPLMITEHTIQGKMLTDRKGKNYSVSTGDICGEKGKTIILAMEKAEGIPHVEKGWAIPCLFRK